MKMKADEEESMSPLRMSHFGGIHQHQHVGKIDAVLTHMAKQVLKVKVWEGIVLITGSQELGCYGESIRLKALAIPPCAPSHYFGLQQPVAAKC